MHHKKILLLGCIFPLALASCRKQVEPEHIHNLIHLDAITSSCISYGQEECYYCSDCLKLYKDEDAEVLLDSFPMLSMQAHELTKSEKVFPKCLVDGVEEYFTCSSCKQLFQDGKALEVVPAPIAIPQLGHEYVFHDHVAEDCIHTGLEAYYTCSRCDMLFQEDKATEIKEAVSLPAKGHSYVLHKRINPTCEASGMDIYYTCCYCPLLFNENYEIIEALPVLSALGHKPIKTERVEPTCTETGMDAYYTCEACNTMYSDGACTSILEEKVILPRLAHSYHLYEKVESSCLEKGYEAYYSCDTCDTLFDIEKKVIQEIYYLPKKEHDLSYFAKVPATCFARGFDAYYLCSQCKFLYADEACEEKLEKKPYLKQLTHSITEGVCDTCGYAETDLCTGEGLTYSENGYYLDVLPIITINNITGENILLKEYESCEITVSNTIEKYALDHVTAGVKVRGNSTSGYEKKPYRIKFDAKQMMLGLNEDYKAKNWVLLADYRDSSMVRNAFGFALSEAIYDSGYVSDFIPVEVYMNGTYQGVYLLCEQQEVASARVNITECAKKYKGTDIGYFIEMDGYYFQEDPLQQFELQVEGDLKCADGSAPDNIYYGYTIKNDIYAEEQRDFIKSYLEGIYKICYNATYLEHSDVATNPYLGFDEEYKVVEDTCTLTAKEAIAKVMDIDSFVATYILEEIRCNLDLGWSSFNMTVDMGYGKDHRLVFQAPWDFDASFGDSVVENDALYSNLNYHGTCGAGVFTSAEIQNIWFLLFTSQDWFKEMVYEKWNQLALNQKIEKALELLSDYSTLYEKQYEKNFALWNNCIGKQLEYFQTPLLETFTTENDAVEYLKNWLTTRIAFLNTTFATFHTTE